MNVLKKLELKIKSQRYKQCAHATRFIKSSYRKVNDAACLIRSCSIIEAQRKIKFCPTKAAAEVRKALQSAIANDQYLNGAEDIPFVIQAISERCKMLKRMRPASKGSAHPIIKHFARIKIILGRPI